MGCLIRWARWLPAAFSSSSSLLPTGLSYPLYHFFTSWMFTSWTGKQAALRPAGCFTRLGSFFTGWFFAGLGTCFASWVCVSSNKCFHQLDSSPAWAAIYQTYLFYKLGRFFSWWMFLPARAAILPAGSVTGANSFLTKWLFSQLGHDFYELDFWPDRPDCWPGWSSSSGILLPPGFLTISNMFLRAGYHNSLSNFLTSHIL